MAWSGGTFSRARDWTTDAAGSEPNIEADLMDEEDDNFATGINSCLHKGGQNSATANLPMGGNRHTGVGNAAALTDYASATDVIDQDLIYYVDSGSADAHVITPSPAISAYAEGQRFIFRSISNNTGATTLNVNGKGATAIQTNDGAALAGGEIVVGGYYEVTYDANGTRFVLTSPSSLTFASSSTDMIAGAGLTGGGDISADRTFNVIAGEGITVNANDVQLAETVAGDGITYTTGVLALDANTAGAGLTHTSGVLAVGGGNGLTANANDVALTDAAATTTNPVDISSGAVSLDVEALTTIEGNALVATDTFYVEDGGVSKGIEVQAMGMRVQPAQTTQTLAAADMNSIMEFTGTATLTLPLNATTALPVGTPVVLNVKHATQVLTVTAAASVTLVSVFHPAGGSAASDTVDAGGTAILFKTAADVWCLSGDIST